MFSLNWFITTEWTYFLCLVSILIWLYLIVIDCDPFGWFRTKPKIRIDKGVCAYRNSTSIFNAMQVQKYIWLIIWFARLMMMGFASWALNIGIRFMSIEYLFSIVISKQLRRITIASLCMTAYKFSLYYIWRLETFNINEC